MEKKMEGGTQSAYLNHSLMGGEDWVEDHFVALVWQPHHFYGLGGHRIAAEEELAAQSVYSSQKHHFNQGHQWAQPLLHEDAYLQLV